MRSKDAKRTMLESSIAVRDCGGNGRHIRDFATHIPSGSKPNPKSGRRNRELLV